MFRDTSFTSFAMLAAERHSTHTMRAEVLLVEFPETQKILNHSFLLSSTAWFWHKAGVLDHAKGVEV